jgi:hypothetical protein
MLDDLLFLSTAFFAAAFIAAAAYRFTDILGNWITVISFILTIGVVITTLVIDHGIVNKLHVWWS